MTNKLFLYVVSNVASKLDLVIGDCWSRTRESFKRIAGSKLTRKLLKHVTF